MGVNEKLRDYQQQMVTRLHEAWRHHRSVMVQMPTGTGKTHVMAAIIKEWMPKEVMIVAHRKELLEQIRATLERFGLEAMGEHIHVESIQRLSRHMEDVDDVPSLVVVDEAHHALAKTYRTLWERWPEARFLGLTATPCRLNGAAFTDLFDTLLQSSSIQEFIDQGWLADFEYVSASPDNQDLRRIRSLQKRGADGDFQTKEMATVMDVPESIEHLYKTYQQFADGKKGIVYAIDREHAHHIGTYYKEKGVNCEVIDCKTPAQKRQELVTEYLKGTLPVLISVDLFGEGFDAPEVEFIQLARPTLSLSKYLQQVGRGMRISAGKAHVLILDNVGLYQLFGLPTAKRDWRKMFLGHATGRGMQEMERCVVVDDETPDKELVNLEMVRIKSGGQKRVGLEIFMQGGRYGVMRNGVITCPAKFRHIERLQKDCGFFAIGIYKTRSQREPDRMTDVSTVIDKKGQDVSVRLYGTVTWRKDYFCGEEEGPGYVSVNCWDPIGNSYYDTYPQFQKVAGVEVGSANEHHSLYAPCMKLRYSTGKVSPRFDMWEIFYNRDIIIARDYLVVKKDHNHSYRICGYLGDSVLVQNEEGFGYQQIYKDGRKGGRFTRMPQESTRIFNQRQLGLQRVKDDQQ